MVTRSYLINCFVRIFSARELSRNDAPTARSMPAQGNAPGTCPRYFFRPERAEGSCALSGRTDRFRNPGRCPGLTCGGAFSAGIKIEQIQIHEPWWSAFCEMASVT